MSIIFQHKQLIAQFFREDLGHGFATDLLANFLHVKDERFLRKPENTSQQLGQGLFGNGGDAVGFVIFHRGRGRDVHVMGVMAVVWTLAEGVDINVNRGGGS